MVSESRRTKGTEPEDRGISEQLYQIAHEQEGGAERVIGQIEVIQNSFEEIQTLIQESLDIIQRAQLDQEDPGIRNLLSNLETIAAHADNGLYNVQGALELYQYQDIVRQKLEKVGHSLVEIAEYVLSRLTPARFAPEKLAPAGRDILDREAQSLDKEKANADDIVADFFAKRKGGAKASNPPN